MFKRPLCEMASGLILGILFMRYQKWYLAAVAAGILFGIVWNLWHNTIRNCSEKDSMANARAWMCPAFRVGCFLAFFWQGYFILQKMRHSVRTICQNYRMECR